MTHSLKNQPSNPSSTQKSAQDPLMAQKHKEDNPSLRPFFPLPKKMEITWYVRLNIMVISFLFVLFLIKKVQDPNFQKGLSRIFANPSSSSLPSSGNSRSAKIQIPKKPS